MIMIPQPTYRSHIGLHFIDEHGVPCTNMFLIFTTTGKAIALADFEGKKCTRYQFADSHQAAADEWHAGLLSAPLAEFWAKPPGAGDKTHPDQPLTTNTLIM